MERVGRVIGFARGDDIFRSPLHNNLSLCREDLIRDTEYFGTWCRFPFDEIKVVVNLRQGL